MKFNSKIKLYATVGLTLGLVVGCGGGSSSDESDPALAELSPETGDIMANNVSKALPGCTYTSADAVLAARSNEDLLVLYKSTIDEYASKAKDDLSARTISARDINEEYQGNCAVPGSYSIVGTHDDGVDDVTYTFTNYCILVEGGSSTLNGVLDVDNVGVPSDIGPIPQNTAVSTGSSGLQIAEQTGEGAIYNHVAKIDNLLYNYGNGFADPIVTAPNKLEANSIVIVDGRDNKEFNVSNVKISGYTDGVNDIIKIEGTTYKDPDTGSINISTTDLQIDENGVLISGSITATGSDGSTMVMNPSATVDNAFDVVVGEQMLGVMDCSNLSLDDIVDSQ
ncbi:hypothetical protein [uncultured Cocleimonas sp.]|uniref:hypothetical protein n=1 Tax=uncultured Cocleimonas sp. TaxID=1051587 RepID=UPI0026159051|nr:hypothetical protein [uncultured Cocleimonas sp.]